MADRSVRVNLVLQAQGYMRGMDEASRKTREMGSEAEKLAAKRQAFDQLGMAALGVGAGLTAMTGLAVKAASDWESAWTGVEKVTNGTEEQLDRLEGSLRSLASEVPSSHEEIAATAEAASRLGVEVESVAGFTRAMIDMGEATDLSADEAATTLARFSNIMGTSTDDVSRLGSSIVELGNNFATSESEIVAMAARLAGAGAQIGMTEGDVTGLAAALSAVGIEAEAGGSAMSKVMIDIAASVDEGGERLAMFADVAGMTADQFASVWQSSPGEALSAFVQGLADAESQGKSALGVLAEFGISEVRMRDALLRSSAAADTFTRAMEMGNGAFEDNTALQDEAARRYETTESKVRMAGNAIHDAAIDMGAVFLPVVAEAAEGVAGLASWFSNLSEPVQGLVGTLSGVAGVIGLVGGGALIAIPKLAEFSTSLDAIGLDGSKMRGRLGRVASFLTGPWALGLGAGMLALEGFKGLLDEARASTAEMQNSLQTATDAAEIWDTFAQGKEWTAWRDVSADIDDFQAKLNDSITLWENGFTSRLPGASLFTGIDSLAIGQFEQTVRDVGEELSTLAASDLPSAQRGFEVLSESTDGSHRQLWALLSLMPDFKDEVISLAGEMGVSTANMESAETQAALLDIALGRTGESAQGAAVGMDDAGLASEELEAQAAEAEASLSDMSDALASVAEQALNLGAAKDQALGAINAMRDAAEEEGAVLDGTNDASIRLRDSIREVEQSHRDSAEAILESGGSMDEAVAEWDKGREAVLQLIEAHTGSAESAREWADNNLGAAAEIEEALGGVYQAWLELPENKHIKAEVEAAEAEEKLKSLKAWADSIPSVKSITLETIELEGGRTISANATGNLYLGGKPKEFAAGGFASGIYAHEPGGIHKFAEEYDEAYISLDPARKDRSLDIWAETGRRLGAWQPSPSYVLAGGSSARESVTYAPVINQRPGVSDRRIAQVAQEEFAFGLG